MIQFQIEILFLDFLFASSVCAMHISRLAEEFIIWNSDGFNLIKLNDSIVTGSSIMPQKKNPDPLEYLEEKLLHLMEIYFR